MILLKLLACNRHKKDPFERYLTISSLCCWWGSVYLAGFIAMLASGSCCVQGYRWGSAGDRLFLCAASCVFSLLPVTDRL